jgi:hypothetical protein
MLHRTVAARTGQLVKADLQHLLVRIRDHVQLRAKQVTNQGPRIVLPTQLFPQVGATL